MARERVWTEDMENMPLAASLGSEPPQPGFCSRTFSPLTAGGIRQSVFTLVQTALGGGVLTLSFMLRLSGVGLGLLLLLLATLVATISMDILMQSAVKLKTYTFSGLLSACLGPRSGVLLDVMLFLYGNGALLTYFIFLGDFMPNIVICCYGGLPSWCFDFDHLRTYCLLSTLIVVIPLSLPKDLSALRYASPVALGGIIYTALVVAGKAFSPHEQRHGEVELFNVDLSVFQSFSICIFAFNCHLNVIPVAKELQRPDDRRIAKTARGVALVQLAFYVVISVGGYYSFLEGTPQNLLSGYPSNDPLILASRVMLSATILVSIATNTNPTVRSMLCLVATQAPQFASPSSPGQQPLLPNQESRALDDTCVVDGDAGLVIDMGLAVIFKDVASVVGFLGASVGTLMMMIIPTMLIQVGCPTLFGPRKKWFVTVLLSVGAIACLTSLVVV
eukprot:TRINITY_DN33163_c0_g1_i1.p1 TRINITY_DN33163_c0_g1~~TRINITY_DN33163_c0_g1_i1.p1  ORF type:complete len:467 (-),score=62.24 TRINITY_DN33163_c0_g1_i1:48-1388(-)